MLVALIPMPDTGQCLHAEVHVADGIVRIFGDRSVFPEMMECIFHHAFLGKPRSIIYYREDGPTMTYTATTTGWVLDL